MHVQPRIVEEETPVRILVVDDEPNIVNLLRIGLKYEGFSVEVAQDGVEALHRAATFKPHLVVLDLSLPGMDGLEVAERLQADPDLLIVMLTARDQVPDRILGLQTGADDYVVKPFDYDELLARIRAVARRRMPTQREILRFGSITVDHTRRVVTVDGEVISLTLREYDLLRLFMLNPRVVLSRQVILDRIWGYDFFGDDNNVEVYVGYLRRKLGDARHLIETIRGVGYRLAA
jgi:DNA-binding response OmpR family regulator